MCSCCKDPPTRYVVLDDSGRVQSMSSDWERLCHILNWYPMPGLEPGAPLPRTGQRAPNKPVHTVVQIEQEQPEILPGLELSLQGATS